MTIAKNYENYAKKIAEEINVFHLFGSAFQTLRTYLEQKQKTKTLKQKKILIWNF